MKGVRLRLWSSFVASGALVPACLLCSAASAQDSVTAIVADQVRSQGFACDKAISAQRDDADSKPNATVYVLTCEGATYRVVLTPDQGAQVTKTE
jgi:hypothetical protein